MDKVGLERCSRLQQYSAVLWQLWQVYSDFHDRKPEDMPLIWLKLWLQKRHPELEDLIE